MLTPLLLYRYVSSRYRARRSVWAEILASYTIFWVYIQQHDAGLFRSLSVDREVGRKSPFWSFSYAR